MSKLNLFLVVGFIALLGISQSAKAQVPDDDNDENMIPVTIIEGFTQSVKEQIQKNNLNCQNYKKYCKKQGNGEGVCLIIMHRFLCAKQTSYEQIRTLIEELYAKAKVEYDLHQGHGRTV